MDSELQAGMPMADSKRRTGDEARKGGEQRAGTDVGRCACRLGAIRQAKYLYVVGGYVSDRDMFGP